jgi:CheY-like chemotaxis protein
VVEDEALILIDICGYLAEQGFTVYEASNARQAMEQLDLHPEIEVMFTGLVQSSEWRDGSEAPPGSVQRRNGSSCERVLAAKELRHEQIE